jgi:hypothetical protein
MISIIKKRSELNKLTFINYQKELKKREQTIKLLEKSLQENYIKIRNLLIFLEKMKDKNIKENIDIIDKEIEKYK